VDGAKTVRLVATPIVLVGAALLVGSAAPSPSLKARAVTVRVTALDYRFTLSRSRVPLGLVRFVVTNRGQVPHDFVIGRARTPILQRGQSAVLELRLRTAGAHAYLCSLPGHAALGMKGRLAVGAGKPSPPLPLPGPPPPPSSADVQLSEIGTFAAPTYVTAPPADPDRLFVVEHEGVIRIVVDGQVQDAPFLDLTGQVRPGSESGLLGLAFAPDYATSGLFYVDYTANEGEGNVRIEEFHRSPDNPNVADPYSGRIVLTIVKPWENHNGGMLQFGPDGYLYISVGDGDSGVNNPPGAFAQALDDLLGNILRIDPRQDGVEPYTVPASNPFVGVAGARPEIWAYGLRNPWRFWVDEKTGDLFIGDVGEGAREEIDYEPAGRGGFNFGWPCFEGTLAFDATAVCPNSVAPVYEYQHAPNLCSVIGGVVVHDPRLRALDGWFLFSDLCGGEIEGLRLVNGFAETTDLGLQVKAPDSFGEDALGRVYVVSYAGPVYRLDPK
jgi:glucose/arabinose dehydrogenase